MTDAPSHTLPLRVYYEDTDAAGIVYHASYLRFAERGRTEMLRGLGFEHGRLRRDWDIGLIVRRCSVDYRAAAHLDDALTVETRLVALGGATFGLDQQIGREGRILVSLDVVIACIGPEGRPRRLPAALREAVADRLNSPSSSRTSP